GIENYGKLVQAFGRDRVIEGFCRIGAAVIEPGVIEHKSMGSVVVGEWDGSKSDRLEGVRGLFTGTGIRFSISDDIRHDVWVKFTWNCIFNMVTALGEVTVDRLFADPHSERLCYELFDEIRLLAEQEGVILDEKDRANIIDGARGLKGFTTSTYNDRQKGRKLEFEAFTGALARLAEKHRVPIPRNRTLYALLRLVASGHS
ncbi:MAG: ketopantoate reductase C-terminal domain-containing protein, partial [Balneolaceae bacterium]|nr:ketopantoate reductase C-terminal domain-containing protein [Balneolaceae bacterium]